MTIPVTVPHTKFLPPTTHDVLERAELVAHVLAQAEAHRITLISAPAGAGKTTLLASLVRAMHPRQCAWLSLDSEDDQPHLFLLGIVGALQSLNPMFGTRTRTGLSDLPQGISPRQLAGAVINDMLDVFTEPFALIVDDLHEVHDARVFQTLDALIERLPDNAHIIVSSRVDPPLALARLRARGHLTEVRFDALRFSADETRHILNAQHQLRLSSDVIQRIQLHTEGWAAGLRLIAVSLARHAPEQRTEAIQRIGVEHRHIFELFADEVLEQQDQSVQRFLIETSILNELTPELCNAVTGRSDTEAILEDMYRRNLFVVVLNSTQQTYRYHALFRQFLEQRLRRDSGSALQVLHLRAGLAETDDGRAVHHLLMAHAWEPAAERIERAAMELRRRGFDVPQHWLTALPAPIVEQRAPLSYLSGVFAEERGDFAVARAMLQRAIQNYAAAGDLVMQGDAMTHLSAVSMTSYTPNGFVEAMQLGDAALKLPLAAVAQARVYLGRVWRSFYAHDEAGVDANLSQVLELVLASDDIAVVRSVLPSLNIALLPAIASRQLMTHFVNTMQARYGDGYGRLQISIWALVAGLRQLEGRLAEANEAALHTARLMDGTGELVYVGVANDLILAMLALARGDVHAVAGLVERRYPLVSVVHGNQEASAFYPLYLALAHWMAGSGGGVEHLLAPLRECVQFRASPSTFAIIQQIEALADLERGDPSGAVQRMNALAARAPSLMERGAAPDVRWVLGYAYWLLRQYQDALDAVAPALEFAHTSGWYGYILRNGRAVVPLLELAMKHNVYPITAKRALNRLDAYRGAIFVPIPGTNDAVSPREMDVLRLIVSGASNQEIADALSVSVWTVKSHVTSILSKLDASSRTQAAARARELHIL